MDASRAASDRDIIGMQVWDYAGLPMNHTKTFKIECFVAACDPTDFAITTNDLCSVNANTCPTRYDALIAAAGRRRRRSSDGI